MFQPSIIMINFTKSHNTRLVSYVFGRGSGHVLKVGPSCSAIPVVFRNVFGFHCWVGRLGRGEWKIKQVSQYRLPSCSICKPWAFAPGLTWRQGSGVNTPSLQGFRVHGWPLGELAYELRVHGWPLGEEVGPLVYVWVWVYWASNLRYGQWWVPEKVSSGIWNAQFLGAWVWRL